MPDRRFVLAGLALFLLAAAYPSWRAVALGTRPAPPALAKSRIPIACVLPPDEMRAKHMQVLAEWRDLVVRKGLRTVTMRDARKWRMSLTGTCLDCHVKAKFCDRCHDYAGIAPNCWSCHEVPPSATSTRSTESTESTGSTASTGSTRSNAVGGGL